MPRTTYRRCKYCHEWHDVANWPANHLDPAPQRSHLAAPRIDRDGLDDLWHPHNGKHYDSKSEFRKVTKASGGEEVGTETQRDNRTWDKVTKDDVAQSVAMLQQGYKPGQSETASEGWN
jgi:hypothetical protein